MPPIDLEQKVNIEFTFKGRIVKAEMPTIRKFEDVILPTWQKVSNIADSENATKEQMESVVEFIHLMVPGFTKDEIRDMTLHQVKTIQEALFEKLPSKNEVSPVAAKS